jgi:hypothetical protein
MDFPRRVVDMHTYLVNACYMPLASIIHRNECRESINKFFWQDSYNFMKVTE